MICLTDLSKYLGDFILDGINLTVQDNEYFVILGPTGAGKTVLLETIAGMYSRIRGKSGSMAAMSLLNVRKREILVLYIKTTFCSPT
jgi:ABC-type sugar transport system ATPase subunit